MASFCSRTMFTMLAVLGTVLRGGGDFALRPGPLFAQQHKGREGAFKVSARLVSDEQLSI